MWWALWEIVKLIINHKLRINYQIKLLLFDADDDDTDKVETSVSVMGTVRNCFGRIEEEVVLPTSANWRHNAEYFF